VTTTAPAPSPHRIQLSRSFQFTVLLNEHVEDVLKNTEGTFRRDPTLENYEAMEQAEKLCLREGKGPLAYPPAGMRSVPPGTIHNVESGETLSGISKKYFGGPGFWDVIYRKNRDLIPNPNVLTAGIKLTIS